MIRLEGRTGRRLKRSAVDFLAALALFWLAALALGGPPSRAYAIALPPSAATPVDAAARAVSIYNNDSQPGDLRARDLGPRLAPLSAGALPPQALILLSITVAGIAAFNLAFCRHLRRVYASQRRGVWRRG
jgi:hypothetical protein